MLLLLERAPNGWGEGGIDIDATILLERAPNGWGEGGIDIDATAAREGTQWLGRGRDRHRCYCC